MSLTTVHYGDIPVMIEANYFVPDPQRLCTIVGETGSLVADYAAFTVTLFSGEHRRRGGGWEAVETGKEMLPTATAEPLRLEIEAFLRACAGAGPVAVTAADGAIALEIVEAAAASARLGREVMLDEVRARA
jgi:predicted dehydrogenase